MDAEDADRAASFGAVAKEYAAHRPDYPAPAVAWLVGQRPATILELGAGTGKLTRQLTSLGHRVIATEPLPGMLAELSAAAPEAHRAAGRAERIPLRGGAVDVVAAGQAYHWFDAETALPEIGRVLRPGGSLSLVWNHPDFSIPWVRKVMAVIGMSDDATDDPVAGSELFETRGRRVFRHWQSFDRDSLVGYVESSSYVAVRKPDEQRALLDEVAAIYDSYGRGSAGMRMPWKASCFRCFPTARGVGSGDEADPDDGLLIDFA